MYFGAAGFESGSYNQHHGWVLWCLGQHYLLTHDDAWLKTAADSMIQGADWVFRQRKNTLARSAALAGLGTRFPACGQPGRCDRLLLLAFHQLADMARHRLRGPRL